MAITLKRQLDDSEKEIILKRHGRVCFATGHTIPDGDSLHFDHIFAYSLGGESDLNNIAPMCETHNKAKGMLPLEDFRIKLRLESFFKEGDRLTLRNLLIYFKTHGDIDSFGENVAIEIIDDKIKLTNHSFTNYFQIQTCPLTGWQYFYGNLPISILNSDDDDDDAMGLQPRYLIFDKVFEMYRHFRIYPVLQPSIGRISHNHILLFDGQHKAASLLWNKRKEFECKIYLDPDLRKLNQANIAAHDKYAQTRFYASVMILKLGNQFGKEFENYRNKEDGNTKNEINFLEYLEQNDPSLTRAERNKRFKSYLYNSILEDESNKLKNLISIGNKGSKEQPLTIDMLSKSLFACFLYTDPLHDDMLSDKYKRDAEFNNILKLFNMVYDLSLLNWDPQATQNDIAQLKLQRIFSSKSILAWTEIFKDAVCATLRIYDTDEKERPFYRDLSDDQFVEIKRILERLINWQLWAAPKNNEIDSQINNSKSVLKEWFRLKGLTTGYLMGANI
jgi:hypothetical protein